MLKSMLTVAALALAGVAQADTVTLSPAAGFGALHQYHEVPTSSGDAVSIYLSPTGIQFWFDSQYDKIRNQFNSYWVGTYNGSGQLSQVQKCVFATDANGNDIIPCQLNGEMALVTLNETSRTVRGSGSGRGGYASRTYWTLVSGTIAF